MVNGSPQALLAASLPFGMLDDLGRRRDVDRHGMLGTLESLPEQLEEGRLLAGGWDRGAPPQGRLAVVGMGGSAIAGDLAAAIAGQGGYPVDVVRNVELPPGLGRDDLLAFVSYSGDTWETLAGYRKAIARGLPSVTLSSGGELQAMSEANGTSHVAVPPGLPPRGALGYLLAPLLALLQPTLPDLEAQLLQAIEDLAHVRERWAPAVATSNNEAKALAHAIEGRTPIIYAPPVLQGVARRWQGELNENAKVLAWNSGLPEADHNELVGWMEDPAATRFAPILLALESESRLQLQLTETLRLMGERVTTHFVRPHTSTFLSQVLELVHLGDMVSVYLALLRGVDPTPVTAIAQLKDAIRQGGGGSAEGEI